MPRDSWIYFFIDLYLFHEKKIEENMYRFNLKRAIYTNGPYEKEYTDGIISLYEDLDYALDFFRLNKGSPSVVSHEELADLQHKIE